MNGMTEMAVSGPLIIALALALAAGAVSFASPCCVPLVPGYLAYLAGLSGGPAGADRIELSLATGSTPAVVRQVGRTRLVLAAWLFVTGFTAVFSAAVMGVLGLSDLLVLNELSLQRIGGVITIAMGLAFLGRLPALQRELRIHRYPRGGLWGAPVLGAVFGLGWTPCLGPTLAGVIALAAGTEVGPTTARGFVLVVAYSLGLGLPFVLLAAGAGWAVRTMGWVRRHVRTVQLVGGALLVTIGVLLLTGLWGAFVAWLRVPVGGFTTPL